MNHFLKKTILKILLKIGYFNVVRFKNRHKITVLMLHGVMAKNENTTWEPLRPQISPLELKQTLQILSKYYQFISMSQCFSLLEGETTDITNGLLITFDDGYRNNIDYALPICEEFGVKPILFVTTSHIDSGLPFWFDRLDYALQQNMGKNIDLSFKGNIYYFDASSRYELRKSYKKFRDHCKSTFKNDVEMIQLFEHFCETLELRSGKALHDICAKDDWSSIASWQMLKDAVHKNRLSVGSHTVDHWRLDHLSEEQILWQLLESKNRIEQELCAKCHFFCYPNGSYNKLAIKLLKDNGYKAAFSTDVGLCSEKDNSMTLKRYNFPINKTKSEIIFKLNH